MSEIGRKLLIIRNQRKLSLRQVEKLTMVIANRHGDKARRISASWLGRIERESHSIAHKRLESLEEVYGVTHDELTDEAIPENDATRSLHFQFPNVPVAVLNGLIGLKMPLLPPESWLAYFPQTTLLPPSQNDRNDRTAVHKRMRDVEFLFGVIGANDTTLVPFVQPGAIVEINAAVRTIEAGKVFHSIYERPIYFLRSHDGYHCGWCELDAQKGRLTLVPSALTLVSHRRWRYRQEVEVVGVVNRVLTRLGFPKGLRVESRSGRL
jgi:transcriptional regulator with XRE-family HTH domain